MEISSKEAVGKRLIKIRDELNLSQERFGELLAGKDKDGNPNKAIDKSTISKYESGTMPLSKKAELELFTSLNVNKSWLYDGQEPMFNISTNGETISTTGDELRRKKAFAPTIDKGLIYVPIAAQAGYTKHFQDPVYLDQMKRLDIPGNPFKGDKYRYFEVEGDSMSPTLLDGMQVIAQKIEQEDWTQIRNYYIHVVVTMSQILVKRLFKTKDNSFVLISDNDELYPQEEIEINSIRELWLVKRSLDWRIPPPKNFEITIDTKSKNN